VRLIKAHAYGNDFLFVPEAEATGDLPALTRALCHRHLGAGADGLILYGGLDNGGRDGEAAPAITMRLFNADGSASELSGNGLRCLAAIVAREQGLAVNSVITVETEAGSKALTLLAQDGARYKFRAAMGKPEELRQVQLSVAGEALTPIVLRMGNPQCVVLGPLPNEWRFGKVAPELAKHWMFSAGTNVEFAHVETPDRVRILIWERGVGPTTSSGTGASAAAVAAAKYGGANREVDVIAPGGTQRVEWLDDGVYLTGWADVLFDGQWTGRV
jgi:diaminopimelate epimerase